MESASNRDAVTTVLARDDGREAVDALLPVLYDELRAMARRQLARERHRGVLSTTALLHEVYIKLVDETRVSMASRVLLRRRRARDAAGPRGRRPPPAPSEAGCG